MNTDTFDGYLTAGRTLSPAIDAAVAFVLSCGPGVALCTGMYLLLCAGSRIRRRIRIRRAIRDRRRQLRQERQQMASLRDDIEAAPLIPTQPGHDEQLLAGCWAAWNAEAREEKP